MPRPKANDHRGKPTTILLTWHFFDHRRVREFFREHFVTVRVHLRAVIGAIVANILLWLVWGVLHALLARSLSQATSHLDPVEQTFITIGPLLLMGAGFIGLLFVLNLRIGGWLLTKTLPRLGVCPTCRYDLQTVPSEPDGCTVCPECGSAWRLAPQGASVPEGS